jgi:putative transposase
MAARLSKLHWRAGNQRRDHLHKVTTWLAKTKPAVVIEDLNVAGMVRNRSLARSIHDVGWSAFRRMLTYKAAWYGMKLIVADTFYPSSKRCSSCGHVLEKLPLGVRKWDCPGCGTEHDRDLNAARNLSLYGTASWAGTAGRVAGNACG